MKTFNLTYYHIVECLLLLLCLFVHRNYPKEFNIRGEIFLITVINWVFYTHIEGYTSFHKDSLINGDECILQLWHFNAFGDMLRALGFLGALWLLTHKSRYYFPLPFTWIFKDLSKFILEPTCIQVFRNYLSEREPSELIHLDRIMKIYLNQHVHTPKTPSDNSVGTYLLNSSENSAKEALNESINNLRPSFKRFKKTIAFKALFKKVKEFEEISQKIYA